MRNKYESIIALGTKNNFSNNLNKKIRLLNTYCLVWGHVVFFFLCLETLIGSGLEVVNQNTITFDFINVKSLVTHFFILTSLISIVFLNKNFHFKWGRFIFISTVIIVNVYASLIISPGSYIEYYFLLISPIAITLYEKKITSYLFLAIGFLCFLTPYYIYIVYPPEYVDRLIILETACIFLVIHLLVNYFKANNLKYERLLSLERDKVLSDKIILEKQEAELHELNEFKSHFFVNLSHEIRTPLTLIQGYTNQLKFKESDKENKQKTTIIKEQCQQMQDIINSIMDLSKMESNQFKLISTPVDINVLLEKHYTNFESLFTKKNINFTFNNKTLETSILVDEELFSKAITNLLSNALKFTPTNGTVSINTSYNVDGLNIDIIDDGIGINKEETEAVFKRFYQVKNDITKSQGSGIGLAFTKSIVHAHNFTIDVESSFGKGCCFTISIPKKYLSSSTNKSSVKTIDIIDENTRITTKKTKTTFVNKQPKILVVDDHEQMRAFLKKVLKNYDVTEAENGKEALGKLHKNSFDLILTDYMMPVMDGENLVKELKKQQNKTPIIVLTARTDQQGKLSMLRLGIDGYLHKPFLEEELLINIKNSIALYKNVKEFDKENSPETLKSLNEYADKFNTKITSYINKNLNSHLLTVDSISEYMNVSRSTLNRKVKSILGQTVNQLIQEARLEKARNLRIEDPFATKKEIAEAVGVTNTTYLFDKLKERYGT
ncbi:response regulator [Polaribacter vadi]|uniref:response regulator n=1 Tax=Polaribacter TaxID=52959 RepID=UPI001C092062|nr:MULTISPECIES: response regulator [Polaribacter]MBU3012785.1 response regulator [Polaribacter vadi]MDO6742601.1 response regulator [Polaribacter sp. 1_MG-2023]